MTLEQGQLAQIQQYLEKPLLDKPQKPLEGQTALITGATRLNGLGFAIAERLAYEGASVIIVGTANSQEIAQYALQRLQAYGVAAHALVADVGDEDSARAMVAESYRLAGKNVDILVNNAGTNVNSPITDVTVDDFHKVFDPKAYGAFLVSREWFSIRNRKNIKGGSVVNIGSPVGSLYGNYGQVPYAMANGAIFGLTQALALEFGQRDVNVNLVVPTFVEGTEITADLDSARIEATKSTTPSGKLATPQDIASAVYFLVSPDGARVNGVVLPVDGGMKSNYTALQPLHKAGFRLVPKAGLKIAESLTAEDVATVLEARRQREGQNA